MVDAFVDRMLMSVILVRDEVELQRFVVKPFTCFSATAAARQGARPWPGVCVWVCGSVGFWCVAGWADGGWGAARQGGGVLAPRGAARPPLHPQPAAAHPIPAARPAPAAGLTPPSGLSRTATTIVHKLQEPCGGSGGALGSTLRRISTLVSRQPSAAAEAAAAAAAAAGGSSAPDHISEGEEEVRPLAPWPAGPLAPWPLGLMACWPPGCWVPGLLTPGLLGSWPAGVLA